MKRLTLNRKQKYHDADPKKHQYDINRFRRRQQVRSWMRNGLMGLMGLMIAGGIFLAINRLVSDDGIAEIVTSTVTFPIDLDGEDVQEVEVYDNTLLLLGNSHLLEYSGAGARLQNTAHNMGAPAVQIDGDKLLLYDQNGTTYLTYENNETVEGQTDQEILLGRLGPQNTMAFVTFEERFNAGLTVYNHTGEQIYQYNESHNYIMGFEFLSASRGVLLQQSLNGIAIDTTLIGLDFNVSEGTEFFQATLSNTVVYEMLVQSNNTILLVTDKGVFLYNDQGELLQETAYDQTIRDIDVNGDRVVLALENLEDVNKTDLVVIAKDGTEELQTTIDQIVMDIYCVGSRMVVLTKEDVIEFTFSFDLVNSFDNNRSYTSVCKLGPTIYAINNDYLFRVD